MIKSLWASDHHAYKKLLGILFQNHGFNMALLPIFAGIPASTLLGRFFTRFWSVFVRICARSAKRAFVKSGTDVGLQDLSQKFHHTKHIIPCLYGIGLLEQKRASSNCCQKVENAQFSKMSFNDIAWTVPFSGNTWNQEFGGVYTNFWPNSVRSSKW